jgi:hypothetical protein
LLLLLPQPWPQQPPLKCPHKSVITKSDFLQSLPGKETSFFSQTSQFSFLLCCRQASKRVAVFERNWGTRTYHKMSDVVRCRIARDYLSTYYLFICGKNLINGMLVFKFEISYCGLFN